MSNIGPERRRIEVLPARPTPAEKGAPARPAEPVPAAPQRSMPATDTQAS